MDKEVLSHLRTCLGCGQRRPKKEMLRIVWHADSLRADCAGKLPGRGGYFCGAELCAQRLSRGRLKSRPPGNCREAGAWQALLANIEKADSRLK